VQTSPAADIDALTLLQSWATNEACPEQADYVARTPQRQTLRSAEAETCD